MPERSTTATIKLSHDRFQYLDSIKGNPKKIIEESYGKLKKLKYYESKLSNWKTIYIFSNNNLIERKIKYYKKEQSEELIYIYDEKRNKVSEIINFGEDKGKIQFRKQIRYDSLGRIKLIKKYYSTGGLMSKDIEFVYSRNTDTITYNNIIYYSWKNDTILSKVVEIYDSLNRLSEEHHSGINRPFKTKWTFIYDKHSNLIEFYFQTQEHETGKLTEPDRQVFEYKYDEFGNWIFKYEIVKDKRIPLVRRKIEY